MNKDQARRWPEEVDVLKVVRDYIEAYKAAHGRAAPNMICEDHLVAVCREAIAAALVKFTQQEPVAWGALSGDGNIYDVICPVTHSQEPGDYTIALYTHPAPSQQEDRKPLTDEQIKSVWVANGFEECDPLRFARAIEAAHNIKEQQ